MTTNETAAPQAEVKLLLDVSALTAIDNRGPATAGELEAARYVSRRMAELGLSPTLEPFSVVPHFPLSWALHSFLALAASVLALYLPILAIPILAFVAVSYYGDTTTRFYWLRRLLPSRESRHVIGKLTPDTKAKKTIVIAAHMDAGQMGFSLNPTKAEPTARFFKKRFGIQPPLLAPIFWILVLCFAGAVMRAIFGLTPFTLYFLLAFGALNLIPFLIFFPHNFAKISPGANDNASGVAVMLDLARRIKGTPLQNSEVVFVGVGSEETYMQGMACFLDDRKGRFDKASTYFLVPESCGVGTPRVIEAEGVGWMNHHDAALTGAALVSAKKLGYKDIKTVVLRTGGTDATPATVRGYMATGILCLNENDYVPNYHWTGDTINNVNAETLTGVTDIFELTIRTIDQTF